MGVCLPFSLVYHVQLFETPGTVACQASLSRGFSRQEHWGGLPCPPPGDLPNPGIEPRSPTTSRFFTIWATREAQRVELLGSHPTQGLCTRCALCQGRVPRYSHGVCLPFLQACVVIAPPQRSSGICMKNSSPISLSLTHRPSLFFVVFITTCYHILLFVFYLLLLECEFTWQ